MPAVQHSLCAILLTPSELTTIKAFLGETESIDEYKRARALPGVADVIDLYGHLSAYTRLVNIQPSQVRNATGGNAV